jgi:hypothetical protein
MNIQQKIRHYFQAKTKQLLALSEQALSDHSGLTGNHREGILCHFLGEIFPKRYSIDHGIVYGLVGQSKEVDIVIWDELNYPKLKLSGSNIFFSEGVKAVIEVKSNWSNDEFEDIKKKAKAAIGIFDHFREGLSGRITGIETELWSLKSGNEYHGRLISPNRKGTAAIIYYGGQNFDIENLNEMEISRIEDEYPDIMLFLEAGKIVLKKFEFYENDPLSGYGVLEQIQCADDALLMFTSLLIDLLAMKSEHIEPPLFLTDYMFGLYGEFDKKEIEFAITRPIAGNSKVFWKE